MKRLVVFNVFIICSYFLSFFCYFFISYSLARFLVFTVPLEKCYDRNISFVQSFYTLLNLGTKINKFLYPSHAFFSDIGWANFSTPCHQNWQTFVSLSCFFSRFRMGQSFNLSHKNWPSFVLLSYFFYRLGLES